MCAEWPRGGRVSQPGGAGRGGPGRSGRLCHRGCWRRALPPCRLLSTGRGARERSLWVREAGTLPTLRRTPEVGRGTQPASRTRSRRRNYATDSYSSELATEPPSLPAPAAGGRLTNRGAAPPERLGPPPRPRRRPHRTQNTKWFPSPAIKISKAAWLQSDRRPDEAITTTKLPALNEERREAQAAARRDFSAALNTVMAIGHRVSTEQYCSATTDGVLAVCTRHI